MHAVHTCQGCRARLGLQEPKPSDKDNQSLTPPKQVPPQLTDKELKSHSATCTSTLYPFYFNLGSFKYVYSSFTFPSTLLFSPMQWNLWLMCWPHFPQWWARKGRTQVDRVSGRCRQAEGRSMGSCLEQKQYHNCSTREFNNHLCHPTSSKCCFKNIKTGHLFDQFKKHLWICMAKWRLDEKLHPIARWSYWGQPAEEYQNQTTPWRPLRFSDERLYIKIKCCYYLGKENACIFCQHPRSKNSGAFRSPLIFHLHLAWWQYR